MLARPPQRVLHDAWTGAAPVGAVQLPLHRRSHPPRPPVARPAEAGGSRPHRAVAPLRDAVLRAGPSLDPARVPPAGALAPARRHPRPLVARAFHGGWDTARGLGKPEELPAQNAGWPPAALRRRSRQS